MTMVQAGHDGVQVGHDGGRRFGRDYKKTLFYGIGAAIAAAIWGKRAEIRAAFARNRHLRPF
jgi:hypothetical protein